MNQAFIIAMNGITYGGLLFMCASGLTLVFGLMQVVNMSHGIFYLVGAYIGLTVQQGTGSWLLGILAGGVVTAVVALLLKISLFERVLGDSQRETLLTLGINLIISDLLLAAFGGTPATWWHPTPSAPASIWAYPATPSSVSSSWPSPSRRAFFCFCSSAKPAWGSTFAPVWTTRP